jgi:hypothetical protein
MRAPSAVSQARAPSTAKLPEAAPAGDDDIPDFLRGVVDAGPTAEPAATKAAKQAPVKQPEPAAAEDDDIPDFLKDALGSGAGAQPAEYNQYDYNQYGGYDE